MTLVNVGVESVATLCGIATTPSVILTPVPPLKCALVSVALGPVYVITPVEEL